MNPLLANIIVGTYAGQRFSRLGDGPSLEAQELRALRIQLAEQHGIKIPMFEEEAEAERAKLAAIKPATKPSAVMEWNSTFTPVRPRDLVVLAVFIVGLVILGLLVASGLR